MQKIALFTLLLTVSFGAFSQKDVLSQMHGLELNGNMIFNISGHQIMVMEDDNRLTDMGIKKLKKTYKLKGVDAEYKDNNLPNKNNLVIENTVPNEENPNIKTYQVFYFLEEGYKTVKTIYFQSLTPIDPKIRKAFMDAYFTHPSVLKKYYSKDWNAEQIDFVGRTIELGDACKWVAPNSVQCDALGEINWTEFDNLEDAEQQTKLAIEGNNPKKIIKTESASIVFEGQSLPATRIVYKAGGSKLLSGGAPDKKAVYYVTAEVRGKYISCVLSYYIYDTDDYKLAPLLKEIMSLKEK